MIPIKWNSEFNQYEVLDQNGKVLWRANEFADAAQFAEDYARQAAFQKGLAAPIRK